MNHPVQILLQSSSTVATYLIKDHTIDMYEGMEVQFPALVNLTATRGKWSVSCLGHFFPWKEPQNPFKRRLGGPQSPYWDSVSRPSSPWQVTMLTVLLCVLQRLLQAIS